MSPMLSNKCPPDVSISRRMSPPHWSDSDSAQSLVPLHDHLTPAQQASCGQTLHFSDVTEEKSQLD